MSDLKYPRVLLKLSGEALAGERGSGLDFDALRGFAREVKAIAGMGAQIGMVIGGGNIVRGSQISKMGMDRVSADYMGMLGTVINALAFQDVLEKEGLDTRVMTAIRMEEIAEPYIRRRAMRHLEKGRVILLSGGTGNPFFTTDTAASLRAIEIGAEVLMKATKVDGVYDSDPARNSDAVKLDTISYLDVIKRQLRVMDLTAISLCMDNGLPIHVFNLFGENSIRRIVTGESIGTLIS